MLDLLGRGYVIQHCVSTFNAIQREDAYKAYSSEILRAIAKQLGVEVGMNYYEMIDSLKPQRVEETKQSADDIIDSIKAKAGELAKGMME